MTASERIGQVPALAQNFSFWRKLSQVIARAACQARSALPRRGEATARQGGGVVAAAAPPIPPKPGAIVRPGSTHDMFEVSGRFAAPATALRALSTLFADAQRGKNAANRDAVPMGWGE